MKKIALVYPAFSHKVFNENINIVDSEFGKFPHVNFGYVANEAKNAGWEVKLFDCSVNDISVVELITMLREYAPDLIGMSAHAAQTFNDMRKVAIQIKKATSIPILVGGYEAKKYPTEIMTHSCFDYLCSGDVEDFLTYFLKEFETEEEGYYKVPNLYFRMNGKVVFTFKKEIVPFKDRKFPDRSIFENEKYYSHVSQYKNFTIGVSSDGCPYSCMFCNMANSGFVYKSAKKVFDEIKDCYINYKIREIDWFDPVMLQNKSRIYELSQLLKKSEIKINWSARTRIDSLTVTPNSLLPDSQFIRTLKEMGCKRLFLGIESFDPAILNRVKKGLNQDQVLNVIKELRKNDIMVLGFFMFGNPGETIDTIKQTIKSARQLPLNYAQFSITIPKPHTMLYERAYKTHIGYDYWKKYMLGEVPEIKLPVIDCDLTREELERWVIKAYISFYFRPLYIFKMLLKIKSIAEIKRYVFVSWKIVKEIL